MEPRLLALLLVACAETPPVAGEPDPCAPGGPVPETIADVVARIDALPAPVTLDCLVASLPRPLPLEATSDVFSAQPAVGERSPRLFVRYPELTLTVVPEGPGAGLLELGEVDPSGRTIKAEIAFPVEAPLEPSAPFDRVAAEGRAGTVCAVCHQDEVEVEPGVFASVWLQPLPARLVPLSAVSAEAVACRGADDERCALLRAVFDHGPVEWAPFPEDLPTIYDP